MELPGFDRKNRLLEVIKYDGETYIELLMNNIKYIHEESGLIHEITDTKKILHCFSDKGRVRSILDSRHSFHIIMGILMN